MSVGDSSKSRRSKRSCLQSYGRPKPATPSMVPLIFFKGSVRDDVKRLIDEILYWKECFLVHSFV